jgi:HAE1 family hydrophobic/amphiphilic exporter-1
MLAKYSVKKPFTVFVAVILILILGTISFMNLKTDLLPSLDLPYLVVMTPYPGASPEEVEMVVTKPVEQLLATTSNIVNVSSVSNENSSVVILEFSNDANMDSTIIEVNGNLDLIKPNWDDSVGTPTIIRMNPDMMPIMVSSIDIKGLNASEVSKMVRDSILPEFESVEGVASVTGEGLVEEKIEVQISSEKIDNLNKKILDNIDSELSKAENELSKAKKEISSGLKQIETEEKKQIEKLAEGEKAIALAKSEMEAAQTQLNTAEEDLIEKKKQAEAMIYAIDMIIKGEFELEDLKDYLPEEQMKELQGAIEQGVTELKVEKNKLEAGLSQINKGLDEIETQKTTLASKMDEVNTQEELLKQGKDTLDTEMGKAKAELKEGQNTINKNIAKLESSKEEAFKKADLEGVITDTMISGILTAQNFSMPAGYISGDEVEYLIKVGDKITSEEEIGKLLLFDTEIDSVGKVYLSDIADISTIDNTKELYAKVNGKDAAILTFQKQSNYSTAEVSQSIRKKIDDITEKNQDITITNLMDQGIYIDIVVNSVLDNLVYGGILAMLILLLFLRSFKPTLIIALSIPISLVFAIAMMYFTGVTINIISLGGLALGVGMLVDNSIVVIENIFRLKNNGLSSFQASIEGAKQVSGALLASTLTTTAVFLPVVFTDGISRQIFTDMGLTIAYSLIASLIVALTLVPVLSSTVFKKIDDREHKVFDRIVNFYEIILKKALNYKFVVVIIVIALLGISVYSTFSMGTSFIPEMEGTEMSVTIEMDKDSTFKEKTDMTDKVVDRLINIEGIETIGAFSSAEGGGGMMGFGGGSGNMSLYVLLDEEKTITNNEIEKQIIASTEDLDTNVIVNSSMDMGALAGEGIQVNIKGNEIDTLREISNDIADILEDTEGTIEVKTGFEENAIELRLVVDKEEAMKEGLTVAQVYSQVSQLISEGKTATTISVDNKEYPVIVINSENKSITKNDLEDLEITSQKDEEEKQIKIRDIAKMEEAQGLSSIRRDSQERYVSVSAKIASDYNIGLVSRDFEGKLENYDAPEGYKVEISGENETINTTLKDLMYMIALAIVFIYLIMVAQFQSLLSPFIVMFTIPLAFTGGLLALMITGNEISIISMLGFLVLSGVVVNNGIVFIDYTNQLRNEGLEKREALIEAGKVRLRPILMTAITTILGLSTLSIGVGMGAEMLQPLAIVAIGGLAYATILTLLVVPAMYDILNRNKIGKNNGVE